MNRVPLKNIIIYLKKLNWNISDLNEYSLKIQKNLFDEEFILRIPAIEDLSDYDLMIDKFITALSIIEEKGENEILYNILKAKDNSIYISKPYTLEEIEDCSSIEEMIWDNESECYCSLNENDAHCSCGGYLGNLNDDVEFKIFKRRLSK